MLKDWLQSIKLACRSTATGIVGLERVDGLPFRWMERVRFVGAVRRVEIIFPENGKRTGIHRIRAGSGHSCNRAEPGSEKSVQSADSFMLAELLISGFFALKQTFSLPGQRKSIQKESRWKILLCDISRCFFSHYFWSRCKIFRDKQSELFAGYPVVNVLFLFSRRGKRKSTKKKTRFLRSGTPRTALGHHACLSLLLLM